MCSCPRNPYTYDTYRSAQLEASLVPPYHEQTYSCWHNDNIPAPRMSYKVRFYVSSVWSFVLLLPQNNYHKRYCSLPFPISIIAFSILPFILLRISNPIGFFIFQLIHVTPIFVFSILYITAYYNHISAVYWIFYIYFS